MNCLRNILLTEFAALLQPVFGGAVVASNQEPGVVDGSGEHKASKDPRKNGISQTETGVVCVWGADRLHVMH